VIPYQHSNKNIVGIRPQTWNQIAQATNQGLDQNRTDQSGVRTGATTLQVKNTLGETLIRYGTYAIGAPLINDIDQTRRAGELVCELKADYTEGDVVCVLQQPLAEDAIGLAVVAGVSLVSFATGGAGDRQAAPADAYDGTVQAADSGPLLLLADAPEAAGYVLALVNAAVGGGPGMAFFRLEDDAGTTVLLQAIRGNYDSPGSGDPEEVVNWSGLLDNAAEGYLGLFAPVSHTEDNPDYDPDETIPDPENLEGPEIPNPDFDPRETITRTIWAIAQGACIPPPEE
jgi:hypothetical protein